MIGVFENMVRLNPQRTCFSYVDKDGNIEALSYRETRMIAAGLASLLRRRGVALGDAVAVDLPNQPACVFLLLAAAYGGFTLVTLNNRLTDAEKQARLLFRIRQPVVQRHQREPAVCRRQQQKHARWLVRQVHGNRVAKRNAATTQQASKTRRNHAGFPVRQRFDVAVFVDIREARALRIEPHHVFEHADHVGNAPAFALLANRSYGNFGNFEKSGLRFSLNASRPSFASSLV